jgi:hypothetical protein
MILPTRLHTATQRDWAEARYLEMFEHAQRGLSGFQEDALVHLRDVFTPARDEVDEHARLRLRALIHAHAGSPSGARRDIPDTVAAVSDAVSEFLAIERSALRALEEVQRQVNALLQRPHPARRFSSGDLSLHLRLRQGTIGVLPYLMDVLREELGIAIENTQDATHCELVDSPHGQAHQEQTA